MLSPQRILSHDIASPFIYRFHDSRALHDNFQSDATGRDCIATQNGKIVLKVIPLISISSASFSVPGSLEEIPDEAVGPVGAKLSASIMGCSGNNPASIA